MADLTASRKRMVAAYTGEKTDRIPICSPISWSPLQDIDREKPGGWRGDPEFIRVARLVQEHCDAPPFHSPVSYPRVFSRFSYQRFLEAPEEYAEQLPLEKINPTRTRTTHVLHAPKGDLFWSYDEDDGIETRWMFRKPVTCPADAENLLSVPYSFKPPDAAGFEPFRKNRKELGRYSLGGGGVNSMVAMLCGIMDYELLLEWVMDEPKLLKTLADVWLERTWERVDFLLSQGVGPFWHFNGVERAAPPMMGPQQWEELVAPYDGEIMRRIKARDPETRIHVHCHGKVGTLLQSWLDMGVNSIDPVEPPPQGNIEIGAARRIVGNRLTFFGNIEFSDMEMCTPDEIENKVRRAIEESGKKRLVLCPSATPHERHTPHFMANAVRYLETGLKYGRY